jgi:KipI family sensor histidine kinase inhibitor
VLVTEIVALGDRAIRMPRPQVPARALVRALRGWPHVVDVVVARDDVAVYFDRAPVVEPARVAALAELVDDDRDPPREHALAAIYDGVDLAEVARATGLDVAEIARRHAAPTYVVETIGFAPGFAYLAGLDPALALPRRATPRARVPAGAIAIADGYTAVYPLATPGGWHVIGRVRDARMFGDAGALLQLGDRVKFTAFTPSIGPDPLRGSGRPC